MGTITVGFSRPRAWFSPSSWLIRLFGGWTPYSHTYIKFYEGAYDRELIFQASGMCVNFMGRRRFDRQQVTVREFVLPVDAHVEKKMIQFAIDKVGVPYGFMDILGIAWVKLASVFGAMVKNPVKNDGTTYVCCLLVGDMLARFLRAKMGKPVANMTLSDVYEYLVRTTPPPYRA
jgi:hypothetical protein